MTIPARTRDTGSHQLDTVFVLHNRSLRPGIMLTATPRFADVVWSLNAAKHQHHAQSLILNFPEIPEPYRLLVKELFYGMLSGPLPPGENRPAIETTHKAFLAVKHFLHWLTNRKSAPPISSLTAQDLTDYERYLVIESGSSHDGRKRARAALRYFWRWRHSVQEAGRLPFDPTDLDDWGEPTSSRPAENAHPRIPEEVMGPLLAWSLRLVDDFAADILAADQEWRRRRTTPRALGSLNPAGTLGHKLQALLDEYVATGRPLPGTKGHFSFNGMAEQLNCQPSSLHRYRDQIERAFSQVGAGGFLTFRCPITATLDGHPWTEAIRRHQDHPYSLSVLTRALQSACYIVIAYLSGMRDSEIKHLRRNSLSVETDTTGTPYRWRLTSLAFKGEDDEAGVPAAWLVGAPVARAIEILERLQPRDHNMLFAVLPHTSGSRTGTTTVLANSTTNTNLNSLIAWINQYCAKKRRADAVPDVDGRPWRLTTSQFRRTLAWFIARRPGGTIAGALQYGHQSIQMFEGYAGTSDSGFRAEVESEQALARGEYLLAVIDSHEHHELDGPGAAEAIRRLDALGRRADYVGQVVLDRNRLKRIMRKHDPAIYPGKFITCVHDPAKALCEKARSGTTEGLPEHGACQPMACRNVALSPGNRAEWRAELTSIDARLASALPPPPLLETRLRRRKDEITQFLARAATESP